MRDLNNPDDLVAVLSEADEPIRTILSDGEIRRIYREGSWWKLMVYALKTHKMNLYAVVAALDGGIAAAEVPEHYTVTGIFAMFRELAANEEYREVFAFFGFTGKKKGAVSSGPAAATTVE